MGYKRKIKTTLDLARASAKKMGEDKGLSEQIAKLYVDKLKSAVMDGKKITLNEFGSFELTLWKSASIYDIKSARKVDRDIKTILFRPSPIVKKKIAD